MIKISAFGALAGVALFLIASAAEARTDRSCSAFYTVFSGDATQHTSRPPVTSDFGAFFVKRTCPSGQPNDCRKRARDTAWDCMLAHGQHSSGGAFGIIPDACTTGSFHNYNVRDVVEEARKVACCSLAFPPNMTRITIRGRTHGGRHCGFTNRDQINGFGNSVIARGSGNANHWSVFLTTVDALCLRTRLLNCWVPH